MIKLIEDVGFVIDNALTKELVEKLNYSVIMNFVQVI